jgi:hypothetical protein
MDKLSQRTTIGYRKCDKSDIQNYIKNMAQQKLSTDPLSEK